MRFYLFPSTFTASFLHPTESLFIPAAVISFGTIMINVTQYGVGEKTGEWLEHVMIVIYWIYCGLAVLLSSGIYLIMCVSPKRKFQDSFTNDYVLQVVYDDLHNSSNDTSLDFPGLPTLNCWTVCCKHRQKASARQRTSHHHWRLHASGDWFYGLAYDIFSLRLPTDDTKTTKGRTSTWHVHLGWSRRLHHIRNYRYGPAIAQSRGT
jgi:hypothetical protein